MERLLLLFACVVLAAAPAKARTQQVQRCIGADGQAVYTDRRCDDLGAVSRLPPAAAGEGPRLFRGGCPRRLSQLVGAIGAAIQGFAIGLPTLRLQGDYLAIATLGLGEIIRITILNIPYVGGASGLMGIPRYTNFTWAFFATVVTVFFIKNFINSSHGRACISIRENEIAAEAMGVDTTKYKVLAFTIGAAFAGVAGGLFSHYFYIAHPASFTFMKSFDILTMVVLGGMGSITGSITAAILLTFISAALASYPEWRMVIYSLLLIVLMIYRPQGLFGNKELSLKAFSRLGGGGQHGAAKNR